MNLQLLLERRTNFTAPQITMLRLSFLALLTSASAGKDQNNATDTHSPLSNMVPTPRIVGGEISP